jgi:ABC-type antimicrobial peptide transport system permease subunit
MFDIGICMALGADSAAVMPQLLRQAMRSTRIGGIVGAAPCAAVLSSMMFGLGAHDPIAFTSVPLFLLAIALLASLGSARRATRINPKELASLISIGTSIASPDQCVHARECARFAFPA